MNASNISVGSTGDVNQTMNAPTVTSRDQLMQDLVNAGLSQDQLDALIDAAERDGEVAEPGPAVTSWFNEIRSKFTAAGATAIWGLAMAYAGLPAAS